MALRNTTVRQANNNVNQRRQQTAKPTYSESGGEAFGVRQVTDDAGILLGDRLLYCVRGGGYMCVRGEKTVGRRNLLGGRDTIGT